MNNEQDSEKQVKAFLEILEKEHGITLSDLRWMARYHRTISRYGDLIAKAVASSIILAVVSGLGYVIIEGLKHIASHINGGPP